MTERSLWANGERVTVMPYARAGIPMTFGPRGVVDMPAHVETFERARGIVRVRFETAHAKTWAWFRGDELAAGWEGERTGR